MTIGSTSETTDETGVAEFELFDGEYNVTASATGYTTVSDVVDVNEHNLDMTIELEALPTLTITVNDGTDAISGATVVIGEESETTDATGKAEFELEYGDYSASISASGYTTKTESLAFRSNHKNFTVSLESATGTVTVTALDGYEEPAVPLAEGTVVLATAQVDWGDPDLATYVVAVTRSFDENGTATLKVPDEYGLPTETDADVPYGTYYLCATGDSIEYSGTLTVDGDETVTITLTPIDNG